MKLTNLKILKIILFLIIFQASLLKAASFNEILFYDEQSKEHKLEDYENKVIILQFWAPWCLDCFPQIKELDKISKIAKKKNIEVIALIEDFKEIKKIQEIFLKKKIKNLKIYFDKKNNLYNALQISSLPYTIILNEKGKPILRVKGNIDWHDEAIKEILPQLSDEE